MPTVTSARFLAKMLDTYRKYVPIMYDAEDMFVAKVIADYLGHAGPKTFTGSPREVVLMMRAWQKEAA